MGIELFNSGESLRFDEKPQSNLVSAADIEEFQQLRICSRLDVSQEAGLSTLDFGIASDLYGPNSIELKAQSLQVSTDRMNPVLIRQAERQEPGESPGDAGNSRIVALRRELQGQFGQESSQSRERLNRDMARIESPNRVPPLRAEQIEQIYEAATRLVRDDGRQSPLNRASRTLLATGIIDNAANPQEIDQGRHNTCGVAVVEEAVFTRAPERAAHAIAQIGLTGTYVAPDGRSVQLHRDQLNPDSEARIPVSDADADRRRNYASQVFQMALINDFYQRQTPPLQYVQRELSGGRFAELLVDSSGRVVRDFNGQSAGDVVQMARNFNLPDFIVIGNSDMIGPADPSARRGGWRRSDGVENLFGRQERLAAILEGVARRGGFPVAVFVYAGPNSSLFAPSDARTQGAHFVSITGYNAQRGTVNISNQWGRQSDRQNVPIAELFRSMRRPQS